MIVPDGRTDEEKLRQLLASPEETHLDFKARLDLTVTKDSLEFVKDAVTMGNRPPGGYIVIGVDDSGQLCIPAGGLGDRRQFDGANLNQKVRVHIEHQSAVISQIHMIDGYDVVMVWVPHHSGGLPVPMKGTGQYRDDNGNTRVVFRPGDVLIREGAANVPLRYAHWPEVLREHDAAVKAEAQEIAQAMLRTFLEDRAQGGPVRAPVPLLMDMANDSFATAVAAHLDAGFNG